MMSRKNISNLPMPPKEFDPARNTRRIDGTVNFETRKAARNEDKERVRLIGKAIQNHPQDLDVKKAKELRSRLARYDEVPTTLASSRYLREERRRVGGAIWKQAETADFGHVGTCTILPANWVVDPQDLHLVDPKRLINNLTNALYRCGAGDADGYFIAGIHGEFEPNSGVIPVHIHAVVAGGMIDVVDQLRTKPSYRSRRIYSNSANETVYQRVRISRQPLINLPDPTNYLLQSFWPQRFQGLNKFGNFIRQREKVRIPEPYHTQVLLWLDRWRLQDITMMIGMRVTNDGLKVTDRKTKRNGK